MKKASIILLLVGLIISCTAQVVPIVVNAVDTVYVDLEPYLSDYVKQDELNSTLSGYLTSIPSEYVTDTELNGSIQGMATQTWVNSALQNYATEAWVNSELSQLQVGVPDSVLTVQDMMMFCNYVAVDSAIYFRDKLYLDSITVNGTYFHTVDQGDTSYINVSPTFKSFTKWFNDNRYQLFPLNYEFDQYDATHDEDNQSQIIFE